MDCNASEFEEESHDVGKQSSMDNTLQWAKEVQNVSKNLEKMSFFDNVSISLSDRDREFVNKHSAMELQNNFSTSKAAGTTQIAKNSNNILRQSVLSSKVVPEHQQPCHLSSNAGQSKLKIDSTVERGIEGLQFGDLDSGRDYQGLSERFGRIRKQNQPRAEIVSKLQRSFENDLSLFRVPESQQTNYGVWSSAGQHLQTSFARKVNPEHHERERTMEIGPVSDAVVQPVHCSINFDLDAQNTPVQRSTNVSWDFDTNRSNNRQFSTNNDSHMTGMSMPNHQQSSGNINSGLPRFSQSNFVLREQPSIIGDQATSGDENHKSG